VLAEQGFTHHASMIHGDYADALESFCEFTGIEVARV
jgi:L-fucose isomerase-like protein